MWAARHARQTRPSAFGQQPAHARTSTGHTGPSPPLAGGGPQVSTCQRNSGQVGRVTTSACHGDGQGPKGVQCRGLHLHFCRNRALRGLGMQWYGGACGPQPQRRSCRRSPQMHGLSPILLRRAPDCDHQDHACQAQQSQRPAVQAQGTRGQNRPAWGQTSRGLGNGHGSVNTRRVGAGDVRLHKEPKSGRQVWLLESHGRKSDVLAIPLPEVSSLLLLQEKLIQRECLPHTPLFNKHPRVAAPGGVCVQHAHR